MTSLDDPIAELLISPARRWFGTGVQAALGLVLVATATQLPNPSPVGIALFLGIGILVLVQALRFYRSATRSLILTRDGLYDSSGAEITRLDNIADVDRGFFAFKPSNGFMIRLKSPLPRAWVPGLWWRFGSRVGIGGATSGKAARDMADVIKIILMDPETLDRIDGGNT